MNREEFLIQASTYIGVAVGMRDNEMVIDGPHAIIEVHNDGEVFINLPERADFFEPEDGDYSAIYKEIVPMIDKARADFDESVLLLRAEVAEHLAVINPTLRVSVSEDCNTCHPRATFYLHDTGIILYQATMYGKYAEFNAWQRHDSFFVDPKKISKKHSQWIVGETGAIEVDAEGFLMVPDLHAFLGANLHWHVDAFITTQCASIPLPDIEVYRTLLEPQHRKFVTFQIL